MKARTLGPEEWGLIEKDGMPPLFPFVDPANVDVVAVEDEGEIVACMTVLRVTHFEGLWIAPSRRGNAGVLRSLLRRGNAIAKERGEQWVMGGAADDAMRGYLGRLGGVAIPMDLFALGVGR